MQPDNRKIWEIFGLLFISIVALYMMYHFFSTPPNIQRDSYSPNLFVIDFKIGNKTENNDYVVVINKSNPLKECSIDNVEFCLYDLNSKDISNGEHLVSNIVGKSIDNETFIVFWDKDGNRQLSRNDFFIIKSKDHIDDDGFPSPGYAETGCSFEIYIGRDQMMIIEL